jgi:DNA-binding MarR family transcriptional regulator
MAAESTPAYRFGDLLALARQSWIAELRAVLARAGYADYRRGDSAAVRLLHRGPVSVGRLGDALGVTRQAARKIAAGLEQRGFATVRRDERDARLLAISLTAAGVAYARALERAIERLNRTIAGRVARDQLAAADVVLRAALTGEHARTLAAYLPPPT